MATSVPLNAIRRKRDEYLSMVGPPSLRENGSYHTRPINQEAGVFRRLVVCLFRFIGHQIPSSRRAGSLHERLSEALPEALPEASPPLFPAPDRSTVVSRLAG